MTVITTSSTPVLQYIITNIPQILPQYREL